MIEDKITKEIKVTKQGNNYDIKPWNCKCEDHQDFRKIQQIYDQYGVRMYMAAAVAMRVDGGSDTISLPGGLTCPKTFLERDDILGIIECYQKNERNSPLIKSVVSSFKRRGWKIAKDDK